MQCRLTSCTPERARLLLSQNRWSLEDTVKSLPSDDATQHHVQAVSLPRTLDVEFERENNTLVFDTQTSPTTAQQVSGLGVQSTTVLDRVYDPSPIPHDQPGILANATTTTDTIPAERTLRMEDAMIDETGEPSASRRALRLHLQSSLSSVALHTSTETAHGVRRCPTGEG